MADSPLSLRTLLSVAGAVGEGAWQGGAQVVWVGLVIDGTEHQTRLVPWWRDRMRNQSSRDGKRLTVSKDTLVKNKQH